MIGIVPLQSCKYPVSSCIYLLESTAAAMRMRDSICSQRVTNASGEVILAAKHSQELKRGV